MRTAYIFAIIAPILALASPGGSIASENDPNGPEALIQRALKLNLAEDPQWLKLGHYEGGLFGTSSQVVGEAFFLAEDGDSDPEAELIATIRGLFATKERIYPHIYFKDKPDHQFPRCQFPARTRFLKKRLKIDESKLPKADCSRFEKYRAALGAKSVSLIFSSFYLNNPSSAFGHSFLRLNKTALSDKDRDRYELLDHGINYAAEVTTQNALLYALLGLAGGFRGTWSDVPYYFKVREYNDHESRDLWSYDLNLTSEEIEMLVAHLWELGSSYFRYFYFTQNCSYQILTAIEAAAPRYQITERLKFYVIPSDTIKEVMKIPGLVNSVSYRPSVRSVFAKREAKLAQPERESLYDIIRNRDDDPTKFMTRLDTPSKARVLDAAIDFLDYKDPKGVSQANSEVAKAKQRLLSARATLRTRSEKLDLSPPAKESPHVGHDSSRLGFGAGFAKARDGGPDLRFGEFQYRFALHDLLDWGVGYPSFAQIEFLNLKLRYYGDSKKVSLDDLGLIRVFSLSPLTTLEKDTSWRVNFGLTRFRDGNCGSGMNLDGCLGGHFELGFGYSASIGSWLTPFALLDVELAYAPNFQLSNLRVGAGPEAGLVLGGERLKWILKGGYRYLGFSAEPETYFGETEARWNIGQSISIGARGRLFEESWESSASLYIFH